MGEDKITKIREIKNWLKLFYLAKTQNKKQKYRVLWDSQRQGTYVRAKHGELK
jgi:hypothetical protein